MELVFGLFSDSSWTAFGRLSECSRSCAWVAQNPLEVPLGTPQERPKSVPRASQELPRVPKSAQERAKRAKLAPKTPPRRGLGRLLGGSWEDLGDIWGLFGSYEGARGAYSKRFIEILKNLEKHCKVLQKSRLGEAEIIEKYAWGLQVGPSDRLWTGKLTSKDALSLQVELPQPLSTAKGAALEVRKLWKSPGTSQRSRAAEVFPYLSGSPYD